MATGNAQLELLAPAGDDECLRAAVANGADAVYFGLEDFNARRRAHNFTLARLPEMIAWLHGRNVKGYVAFNTLVMTDELPRAAEFVRGIISAGADAVIVQDLGLVRLVRQISPTFPIHASTQMTQTHPEGLALLRDHGVSRVILARELSLAEIKTLASAGIMALEVFVHGAMCVSYSGACLASESLWGRSGNRGVCGQACRLPYELIVDGRAAPGERGPYLLSPHDLATYDRIGELVRAGVTAFKIEGRLKDAQYVALTTGLYREAIDAAVRGESFTLSAQRARALAMSFSRGFTCGFLDGNQHQALIGADSPRSRGVLIGAVVGRSSAGVVVRLEPGTAGAIKPGDGVVFAAEHADDVQGGRVYSVKPCGGPTGRSGGKGSVRTPSGTAESPVELTFGRGDLDLDCVAPGAEVFKTDDPAIRRELEATYARDRVVRHVPVRANVQAAIGQHLRLILTDDRGLQVQVQSDEPMQQAERQPVTLEMLREQLSRLGDTPFELAGATLSTYEPLADKSPVAQEPVDSLPVMVPRSVINELRRRATAELIALRERASRHAIVVADALGDIRGRLGGGRTVNAEEQPICLHVLARSLEQFAAACEVAAGPSEGVRVGTVYADWAGESERATAAKLAGQQAGVQFGLTTPQVLKPGEEWVLDAAIASGPDVLLVRNLAALRYVRQRRPEMAWVADFSLNTANDISAAMLVELGATRVTPGLDLNVEQLAALAAAAPGLAYEWVVHAHVPMFHMAHCLAAASLSQADDCGTCGRPCAGHVLHLRDRNREDHPIRVDTVGRTTVYNSRAQSIVACRRMPERWPVRHVRIELLDEDGPTTRRIIGLYQRLIAQDRAAVAELRRICPGMVAGAFEHA